VLAGAQERFEVVGQVGVTAEEFGAIGPPAGFDGFLVGKQRVGDTVLLTVRGQVINR
jgi:hypothetical protein